ncbi:MAG: hypothetical protein ABI273_06745, partial [Lacunisphaera sp.]
MTTGSSIPRFNQIVLGRSFVHRFAQTMSGVLCVILLGLFTGCETPPPPSPMTAANSQPEVLT